MTKVMLFGDSNPTRDAWLDHLAQNPTVEQVPMLEIDRDALSGVIPKVRFYPSVGLMLQAGADGAVLAYEPMPAGAALTDTVLHIRPGSVTELLRTLVDSRQRHTRPLRRIALAAPAWILSPDVQGTILATEEAGVAVDAAVPQLLQAEPALSRLDGIGELRSSLFLWSPRQPLHRVLLLQHGLSAAALFGAVAGWTFATARVEPTPRTEKRLGAGTRQFDVVATIAGVAHQAVLEAGNRELPGEEVMSLTLKVQGPGGQAGLAIPLPLTGEPSAAWTYEVDDASEMHVGPTIDPPAVPLAAAREQEARRWVASLTGGRALAVSGARLIAVGRLGGAMVQAAAGQQAVDVDC